MGAWGFDIFRSYGTGSCDDDDDDDDDDDFLFIPEEKWRDGPGVALFNRTSSCCKPRFFYSLELEKGDFSPHERWKVCIIMNY